jgi:hypothetical protein
MVGVPVVADLMQSNLQQQVHLPSELFSQTITGKREGRCGQYDKIGAASMPLVRKLFLSQESV